jgi:hypothetical protein
MSMGKMNYPQVVIILAEDFDNGILFQAETGPTPSLNIHIFLPSGVEVIAISSWVDQLAKAATYRSYSG